MKLAKKLSPGIDIGTIFLFALALAFILHDFQQHFLFRVDEDFSSFHCAGKLIRAHINPYRYIPLHTCEVSELPYMAKLYPLKAIPVPFIGYTLAFFIPWSWLNFTLADDLWFVVNNAAYFGMLYFLCRLTRLPISLLFFCTYCTGNFHSLASGDFVVFISFAFVLCLWALHTKNTLLAVGGALLMMTEPNIGLPVVIALALLVPQSRGWLALGASAAILISLLTTGIALNLEYFTKILPLHALAEVGRGNQFSLSHLLHVFGFTDAWALRLGSLSYGAMLIVGTVIAHRVYRITCSLTQSMALVPVPVLIGGTYIHLHQFIFATLAALVVLGEWEKKPLAECSRSVTILRAALIMLAAPFQIPLFTMYAAVNGVIAAIATFLLFRSWKSCVIVGVADVIGSALYLRTIDAIHALRKSTSVLAHAFSQIKTPDSLLAEEMWRLYLVSAESGSHWLPLLFKLPIWAALIAVVVVTPRLFAHLAAASQPAPTEIRIVNPS